jgi:hypothetical protein
VNQDNSTDLYVDNAIQTDICRSPDGNLNNTFVQNSCDDSTNASTSTNAHLGADGIASDQVTVIDLAQEYAEPPTSEPVSDVSLLLSGVNNVNDHVTVNESVNDVSL